MTRWGLVRLIAAIGLGLAVAVIVLPAQAQGPWYVAPSGSDGNTCLSPAAPCATLNGAIGKAATGDTIRVAVGTYTGVGLAVATVDKAVIISGGWNANFTTQTGLATIDGQGSRRGIDVQACSVDPAAPVVLERLHITHGFNAEKGGGVHIDCAGATVVIRASHLELNEVGDSCCGGPWGGGGLYSTGTVTVTESTFSGNKLSGGVRGSAIYNGGQMWLENSTLTVNDGTNTVLNWLTAALTMTHTTLSDNLGVGLDVMGGRVELQNNILSGNSTHDCTVESGYGGTLVSLGGNVVETVANYPSQCSLIAGDKLGVDPLLQLLADHGGPVPLRAFEIGSPARNAGIGVPLGLDQRGAPRYGPSDSGAYEAFLGVESSVTGLFRPGETVTLTLQVSSLGNAQDLTGVRLVDVLPAELTLLSGTVAASGGLVTVNGNGLEWNGTIASNMTTTVSFAAQIAPTALGTTITNTAVANWSGVPALGGTTTFDTWARVRLPLLNRQACSNFADAFDSADTRWPVYDDAFARLEVLGGEYRILGKQTGYIYVAAAPTCGREAYRVQASGHWAATTPSEWGLVFGADVEFDRFYFFSINTLYRTYALYRFNADGSVTTLVAPTTHSPVGATTSNNTLAVVRNGTAIVLVSNGTALPGVLVSDPAFAGLTWVGLAMAPGAPNADARFDGFSVQLQALSASQLSQEVGPELQTPQTAPLRIVLR